MSRYDHNRWERRGNARLRRSSQRARRSEARQAHEMIEDKDLRLDGKIIVVPP
jgi:hypothetical protein